jgi:hypothetical protein
VLSLLHPHDCHVTCMSPVTPSGQVLVRCYGEHSSMWVPREALAPWQPALDPAADPRVARMHVWGKANGK